MPATRLYFHPAIARHDAAANHVIMAPERVQSIWAAVRYLEGTEPHWAQDLPLDRFALAHDPQFLQELQDHAPTEEGQQWAFNRETVLNMHTLSALRHSAGAACQAVRAVLDGAAANAFCCTYAGHHAGRASAQGFCITNPVAIAARYALYEGVEKVVVLDFDTHSGNGTIDILREDVGRVLFAETYQKGYPGNFLRGPAPAHILRRKVDKPSEFLLHWKQLLQAVRAFEPELVLVSAGFDAHAADPLSVVSLQDWHYEQLFAHILEASPRVVSVLEGGYNLETTQRLAAKWVQALVRAGQTAQPLQAPLNTFGEFLGLHEP